MYVRTATRGVIGLALAAVLIAGASSQAEAAKLGHPRPRLRPRGRHECLRRLRATQARPRLPLDPRPLLPAHPGRPRRPRTRSGCCWPRARARSASRRRSKACGKRLHRHHGYRFSESRSRGRLLQRGRGRRITACGRAGDRAGRGAIRIGGKGTYRGKLVAKASGGGLLVINVVGLDDYAQGVVAERDAVIVAQHALRAQAVAARSYRALVGGRRRLRRLRRHPKPGLRGQGHRRPRAPTGPSGTHGDKILRYHEQSPPPSTSRPPAARPRASSSRSGAQPVRVPEERQGPLRRHLAVPHVDGPLLAGRDGVAPQRPVLAAGCRRIKVTEDAATRRGSSRRKVVGSRGGSRSPARRSRAGWA